MDAPVRVGRREIVQVDPRRKDPVRATRGATQPAPPADPVPLPRLVRRVANRSVRYKRVHNRPDGVVCNVAQPHHGRASKARRLRGRVVPVVDWEVRRVAQSRPATNRES